MRLMALLLALAMLLAGCGGQAEDGPAENPSETVTHSETISIAPAETPSNAPEPSEEPSPPSEEDAALLARTGLAAGETRELTSDHVNEIKGSVASMRAAYVAGPGGKDPLVEERDWNVYTSRIGAEKLSNRETELYNRLNKLCLDYLKSSALSGVKCRFSDGTTWDVTDTVSFSDLGLSKNQAKNVAYWFKWNHPQYYFIENGAAIYSNDEICLQMYNFTVSGEKRAEVTNQLFGKLEGWIADINSRASTTYEKELYANILLCEQNIYEEQFENQAKSDLRYDQSLYSAVLLGKTVCAGYALGFCAMMSALDIDTTVALSSTHAWNVVRCDDGNCYAVDVCWNDTDSNPPYKTDYLNVGEEIMLETNSRKESHTYEDAFAAWIPAIAKENYDPAQGGTVQLSDAPRNLRTQEVGPTSITLAWSESAGAHLNHRHQFEVAVFADPSRSKQLYNRMTSESTFTLETLNPNINYEIGIRFRCNDDDYVSEWTCLTVATADGEPKKLATTPYNIKTEYQNANQAKTSWFGSDFRSFTSPEVCQYTDSTCTQTKAGYPQDPGSNYSYTWMDLEPGKTYYFGIRLSKKDGVETIYSDWVNFSYTHMEHP